MTRNQTPDHKTITLEKFSKRVASAVDRFFDVSTPSSLLFRFLGGYSPVLTAYISIGCRRPDEMKGKTQTGRSVLEGSQKIRSLSLGLFTSLRGAGNRSYN